VNEVRERRERRDFIISLTTSYQFNEPKAISDLARLDHVARAPLTRAPVESPALVNDEVHGSDSLLDESARVGSVAEEQVDVFESETHERALGGLDDVLAAQSLAVGSGGHGLALKKI